VLVDAVCIQALEQMGGAEMAEKYKAKYLAFTSHASKVESEEALRAELQAAKDDARNSSAALAEALMILQRRQQEDLAKNRKSGGWFW
jgi:hypothetical protein